MKLFEIFNRKNDNIGYNSLSSGEKKRIIEGALRTANKEQLELVRAYRESSCKANS